MLAHEEDNRLGIYRFFNTVGSFLTWFLAEKQRMFGKYTGKYFELIAEQDIIIYRTSSYLCNVPSDHLELALSNLAEIMGGNPVSEFSRLYIRHAYLVSLS